MLEKKDWQRAVLSVNSKIKDSVYNLECSKMQIVLVVDDNKKLVGTITDGDIRRALLNGLNMDDSVLKAMNSHALVVPSSMGNDLVKQTMKANKLLQLPVVDESEKLVGLHLWSDSATNVDVRSNIMIICAGGLGKRLRPRTENCPKPMLEVRGKPILEHIINKAREEGFKDLFISTYYLGHMIEDYFEDGQKWGVNIQYLREKEPLGTAGALSLISEIPENTFIVTNGDVLTQISYGNLLEFHKKHNSIATMAIRRHEMQNPFGVVKLRGLEIEGFEEKPTISSNINAGVYAFNPQVLNYIPNKKFMDMPSLFENLKSKESSLFAYPMHEDWLDIGRISDLQKANK